MIDDIIIYIYIWSIWSWNNIIIWNFYCTLGRLDVDSKPPERNGTWLDLDTFGLCKLHWHVTHRHTHTNQIHINMYIYIYAHNTSDHICIMKMSIYSLHQNPVLYCHHGDIITAFAATEGPTARPVLFSKMQVVSAQCSLVDAWIPWIMLLCFIPFYCSTSYHIISYHINVNSLFTSGIAFLKSIHPTHV